MRYCHNISMDAAKRGFWVNTQQENTIYIQITDPCCVFEPMTNKFAEFHQFEFLDVEDESDDFAISDKQSKELALILRRAMLNDRHVIVSCHAGLCRSGAVTEVMHRAFGYEPATAVRIPNSLVLKKLMRDLGFGINDATSMFTP